MDEQDLTRLGAAARAALAAPVADPVPVLVPVRFRRRLFVAVVDALTVLWVGGAVALLVTTAGWGALFHTDFEGPPGQEALGTWLLLSTWCALVLAYTAGEAMGFATPGKSAADLRLVVPAGNKSRRLLLRWFLAYLPVIVVMLVGVVGTTRTCLQTWEVFEATGWEPEDFMPGFLLALAVPWAAGFALAAGPSKKSLADRLSGVELLHALPPLVCQGKRGFSVVVPGAPAENPPPDEAAPVPHA